ncbi:MAG: type II secretion system F family protein [Pseudomonadales bacterium]|nr:type II secretion system F family protein [Pseudomonadales bacterium]
METIIAFITSLTSDPATVRFLVIMLAAGTVGVFGLGVMYLLFNATDPVRRRLSEAAIDKDSIGTSQIVHFHTFAGRMAKYVVPTKDIESSETVRKLVLADLYSDNAVANYYSIRAILMIAFPASVLVASSWMPQLTGNLTMLYTACAAGFGYILPSYILDRLVERRQKALRLGFPDALDLMVVCIESGLGLAQAIQRVADELMVSHPELATELATVNAEMRAGIEATTALKNLAERTGLEDIRGLVSTLVQTLRFGTGVSDALRVYSDEFRDRRTQAAEERAAKMGTKLIFPLVLFMFPAFFVVAIGPAVIQLMDTFQNLN